MAKIVIDCADPNDLDAMYQSIEDAAGKCNITYFKQHEKLVEAGKSKGVRESSRIIAKDEGVSEESVRNRIRDGKNKVCVDHPETFSKTEPNSAPEKPSLTHQDGRDHLPPTPTPKRKPRLAPEPTKSQIKEMEKQQQMTADFKAAYETFYGQIMNAKMGDWKDTSKEAALNCIDQLFSLTTIT